MRFFAFWRLCVSSSVLIRENPWSKSEIQTVFTHLHTHSNYSFLDGVTDVGDLVEAACRLRMKALALTDTNGFYGVIPFWMRAKALGVKPIIGAEVDEPVDSSSHGAAADRVGRGTGDPSDRADKDNASTIRPLNRDRRAVVLARDRTGYAAISALITRRQLASEDFDLVDELARLLDEFSDAVFVLTDTPALLEALAGRPGLYGELILTRSRRGANRRVYDLARENDTPLVVTNDVHFLTSDEHEIHRVARAIASRRTADSVDEHWLVEADNYLKSEAEMKAAARGLTGPLRATEEIADACNVEFTLRDWQFPRCQTPDGETPYSVLAQEAFDGVRRRYRPLTPAVTERLEYELKTIDRLGFSEYFLAVREIVAEAERRGSPVLGRGSAANSIVSYVLGFTPVDPLRLNLYFERFLNPARRTPPDIDLDFSWRERDDIVEWVFEHFGWDRVALIATTIRLRARQAIREVGKAFGVPDGEISAFTRPIPGWFSKDKPIRELLADYPECRHLPVDEEPWRDILPMASRFLDAPRNLSIHCGGLVITPRPITDYTPLQRSGKNTIITQMDMYPIEELGLIKIDMLSNRSLGVYRDTVASIVNYSKT